jgi:hypothetical protein
MRWPRRFRRRLLSAPTETDAGQAKGQIDGAIGGGATEVMLEEIAKRMV